MGLLKTRLPLLILPVIGICLGAYWLISQSLPEGGSTEELLKKINSSHRDTVLSGYYYLTERRDPSGREKAVIDLSSDEDYIWLNAALYLGSLGDEVAVPYLIKALRHTAWRSDEQTLSYLRKITQTNAGSDYADWKAWWDNQNSGIELSWDTWLGHNPRLPN
ncbi:hypothetical protein OAI07_01525 [Akkermansiaceae bacterium]|nr:hypothetical protein [Akkermansiaceae bacterium]